MNRCSDITCLHDKAQLVGMLKLHVLHVLEENLLQQYTIESLNHNSLGCEQPYITQA